MFCMYEISVFLKTCMIDIIRKCFLHPSFANVQRCPSRVSADEHLHQFHFDLFKIFIRLRIMQFMRILQIVQLLCKYYATVWDFFEMQICSFPWPHIPQMFTYVYRTFHAYITFISCIQCTWHKNYVINAKIHVCIVILPQGQLSGHVVECPP